MEENSFEQGLPYLLGSDHPTPASRFQETLEAWGKGPAVAQPLPLG